MGSPKQEYWSGLPFPSPGYLTEPVMKPVSLTSPALAGRFFTTCYLRSPSSKPILKIDMLVVGSYLQSLQHQVTAHKAACHKIKGDPDRITGPLQCLHFILVIDSWKTPCLWKHY